MNLVVFGFSLQSDPFFSSEGRVRTCTLYNSIRSPGPDPGGGGVTNRLVGAFSK